MRSLLEFLSQIEDERGQTLVEYALIIAFIAIALVASLTLMGTGLQGIYQTFVDAFP
jgi:Flp pilus assembly pilin Flp